jgi:hypothetical protein
MSLASYERQLLAMQAAGYINGSGSTVIAFGCQLTRISIGHYGLILDASDGVVADESFTKVQVKGTSSGAAVVQDLSDTEKRIRVFNSSASLADKDIEIALWKSVTRR